jgi:Alginate lyase
LTWLVAQKVAITEYIGDKQGAKTLLEDFMSNRLPEQITADGAQPEELKRTKSFHYSDAIPNWV